MCVWSGISVFADGELFREFLQRPLKRGSSSRDIDAGLFAETAISHRKDLVLMHFQQYPVLHVNLKVIIWLVSVLKGVQI